MPDRTCSIDGCEDRFLARGWCRKHYYRWKRTGSVADPVPLFIEERFWSHVDQRGYDDCWPWTGTPGKGGYGVFKIRAGELGAPRAFQPNHHRVAFRLVHGHWPEPLGLHGCDNRICSNAVNPLHVHEGTYQRNAEEMWERGRAVNPPGEDSWRGKLTNAQAQEIRLRYGPGGIISQQTLADEYGVNQGRISQIVRNITYRSS